jgi:hypothetical protein
MHQAQCLDGSRLNAVEQKKFVERAFNWDGADSL